MTAYYNENDPYAAAWLKNLIDAGHIARGDVDERSIVDVRADDLAGFDQCHFFAGIGGWSLALRLAGWPDDRPVWSGSCPCQPFSAAGAGKAADDERHLWPAWFPLIAERRPAIVFGEQVEAAIGWGWLDAVFADLEAEGYACGASVLPACGVGAPHIRQRCWFVGGRQEYGDVAGGDSETARSMADASSGRHEPILGGVPKLPRQAPTIGLDNFQFERGRPDGSMGDAGSAGLPQRERDVQIQREAMGPHTGQAVVGGGDAGGLVNAASEQVGISGRARQPRGSAWSAIDWLPCTDGKARPVEPGTFPLAHGIPGRVGRLRAYGNAIVPRIAAEFIIAASEAMTDAARSSAKLDVETT